MKAYTPNHRFVLPNALLLLVLSLVGGAALGGVAYLASGFWYLIILFAAGMAFIAAVVARKLVGLAEVRNAAVAGLCGIILGLLAYTVYQGIDFVALRQTVLHGWQEEYGVSAAQAAQAFDETIQKNYGLPGLLGFLAYKAQTGEKHDLLILVGGASVLPGTSFRLSGVWMWLQWLIEVLLVTGSAAVVAIWRSREDYCESGPGWYEPPKQIGSVMIENKPEFLARLQAGDMARAGELVVGEEAPHPTLEIYARRCHKKPAAGALLALRETMRDARGLVHRRTLLRVEVSGAEMAALTQGLKAG